MPPLVSDASRQRRDGGLPRLTCLERFISRFVRLSQESRDSRATSLKSGDDSIQAPRGQRRPCVSDVQGLVCPPSGSATPAVSDGTGGQASYSFFQSCYRKPLGQHGQGSAAVIMRRPWFLILARLPGQRHGEPQALLSSRVARRLPTYHPEVEVCKVWFVSAATVRKRLSDLNVCTAMPSLMFGSSTPKQPRLIQVKCCPTARADITDMCGCRRRGAGTKR